MAVQNLIEEAQKQEPIPTFALFKKQNSQLATNNLKMAQDYIEAEEYEEALNAYSKAFQFTQEWTDYQKLPLLFEKMKNTEKARLAYLYLIQYQLQAQKLSEALQTLEDRRKKDLDFPSSHHFLFQLYLCNKEPEKALTMILDSGEKFVKENPSEALHIYQQIITQDPTQFKAYEILVPLLSPPPAKKPTPFSKEPAMR